MAASSAIIGSGTASTFSIAGVCGILLDALAPGALVALNVGDFECVGCSAGVSAFEDGGLAGFSAG